MWKCYYTNQCRLKTHGYYINDIRVLSIQKIRLPFGGNSSNENLFRLVFYDESGRYVSKEYDNDDNFEIVKLRGLLRLKEMGLKIKTLKGE